MLSYSALSVGGKNLLVNEMKPKPYPCLWLPVDCSIYDRGAHDQGCRHHDLEMIQLITLLQIFQKNYPRFLVHVSNDGIYRVSQKAFSFPLGKKVKPIPSYRFDISIVHMAFVIDGSVQPQNAMAMSVIESLLGRPQV